ncbi:hypothetical protein NON20_17770 [Synechocystis sp. B12]|nr:hypothetical protein NON20_17770 [Synechocystis sp. B12]
MRDVQEALIGDRRAPAAVIPLFNLVPDHPEWRQWQQYYLDNPDQYPPQATVQWMLIWLNCPYLKVNAFTPASCKKVNTKPIS